MNLHKIISSLFAPVSEIVKALRTPVLTLSIGESKGNQPEFKITDGSNTLPSGTQVVEIQLHPEAERIAASLRDFPGDWSWRMKGYQLEHTPTGFVMWVANEGYGLAEVTEGHKVAFKKGEQAVIWPAVQAWLDSHKVGFTGRLPKVRLSCRKGTWWCVSDQHPWAGAGETPEAAYRSWARAVSVEARTDQRPGEILHVWSAAR
ncbi:hypothetical protein [Pseudomonas juntendi]|uniref:hypothetical protein n=1 Tax=Pseudomonas juntendi TaxID=2666183 RepID=UPI001C712398|nr:hypothetical protein [Pseudomonas juntendi]